MRVVNKASKVVIGYPNTLRTKNFGAGLEINPCDDESVVLDIRAQITGPKDLRQLAKALGVLAAQLELNMLAEGG